jgi:hypothetical protein
MKIAVIENTKGLHNIYEDMFFIHTVDFFESIESFIENGKTYPVVIVDHVVNGVGWERVYDIIDNETFLIVTSTFPKDFYKKEFPETLYKSLENVNSNSNAVYYHKDQKNRFLDYISRSVELEALRANCRA